MRLRPPALWLAFVWWLAPLASEASDGVLEINRECALNTGCFPGDAPGWPVSIEGFNPGNPGAPIAPSRSFRLTSDLGPLGANDTAIVVHANNATIDLGGFRIFGSTQCSVVPTTCSPLGSGVGVLGGSDVTVKNGAIHGMGDDGVRLDYSSRVEGVNFFHNGGDGIQTGNESLVRGNVVTSNGRDGVHCFLNCAIHDNTFTGNGDDGIDVVAGTVTGNSASYNGAFGARFAPEVAFGLNQFTGNTAGDVSGGHAAAGNACFDGTCSRRGARRYYMTKSFAQGNEALAACGVGFHMAHLAEIHDASGLEYDTTRGYTLPDSGGGPPMASGWVRNGNFAGTSAQFLGNCLAWTSNSASDFGWYAIWANDWDDPSSATAPWIATALACNSNLAVWCVED